MEMAYHILHPLTDSTLMGPKLETKRLQQSVLILNFVNKQPIYHCSINLRINHLVQYYYFYFPVDLSTINNLFLLFMLVCKSIWRINKQPISSISFRHWCKYLNKYLNIINFKQRYITMQTRNKLILYTK